MLPLVIAKQKRTTDYTASDGLHNVLTASALSMTINAA